MIIYNKTNCYKNRPPSDGRGLPYDADEQPSGSGRHSGPQMPCSQVRNYFEDGDEGGDGDDDDGGDIYIMMQCLFVCL